MHIMLFLALRFNRVIISCHFFLPRTLREFLDNCKNANENQSSWNVKLQKTKAKKADESPIVIAFLKLLRIQRKSNFMVQ